jgi:hypothetical protein
VLACAGSDAAATVRVYDLLMPASRSCVAAFAPTEASANAIVALKHRGLLAVRPRDGSHALALQSHTRHLICYLHQVTRARRPASSKPQARTSIPRRVRARANGPVPQVGGSKGEVSLVDTRTFAVVRTVTGAHRHWTTSRVPRPP